MCPLQWAREEVLGSETREVPPLCVWISVSTQLPLENRAQCVREKVLLGTVNVKEMVYEPPNNREVSSQSSLGTDFSSGSGDAWILAFEGNALES